MPNLPNLTFRVLNFGAGGFSKTPPNPKHARYGLFVVLKFGAGHFQKFLQTKSTISRPYIRRGTAEKMPNLPNSTFRVLKIGAGEFSKTPANVKHARYG